MRHAAGTGRKVLDFLESNDLEATPSNYRLGYVFVTAGCSRLVKEINGYIDDKLRIRQANMDDMMKRHAVEGRQFSSEGAVSSDEEDSEEREREMTAFATAAMALVKDTRRATGELTRDLTQESEIIQSGARGEALEAAILRMVLRSQETEDRLKESSKRIKRLQTDLEEARNTATVDELTGLRNRRAARQLMETLDAGSERYAVAVIDIDNFKRINDTFGHPVGDRVIAHVGRVLSESVAPEMVARWGGEEFLIVSREMSCAQMHDKLDEARRHLRERHLKVRETDKPLGTITFSAGISPSSGNSTECVEIADGLLYEAKQNGRDQIRSSSKLKAA